MKPTDEKFQGLKKRVGELPNLALEIGLSPVLVLVPHHDLRQPFAELAKDAFLDFGFAVDLANANKVLGDEFVLHIGTISRTAGKGLSLHTVYVPTEQGLVPNQVQNLRDLKKELDDQSVNIVEY